MRKILSLTLGVSILSCSAAMAMRGNDQSEEIIFRLAARAGTIEQQQKLLSLSTRLNNRARQLQGSGAQSVIYNLAANANSIEHQERLLSLAARLNNQGGQPQGYSAQQASFPRLTPSHGASDPVAVSFQEFLSEDQAVTNRELDRRMAFWAEQGINVQSICSASPNPSYGFSDPVSVDQDQASHINQELQPDEQETTLEPASISAPAAQEEVNYNRNWAGSFTLANGMLVKRTKLGISVEKDGERIQHSRALNLDSGRNLKGYAFQNDINLTREMTADEFMEELSRESTIVSQTIN